MNLYDILLARCICSNKEDESITVTPLEVTENGEYEAEEGYAYNPVTVNVSSDFSTAQVTIYNTGDSGISVFVATISEGELAANINIDGGANETVTTVLYKGTQAVWCASSDVIEVTGDAEIDDGMAIVSGDCTIKFE